MEEVKKQLRIIAEKRKLDQNIGGLGGRKGKEGREQKKGSLKGGKG